MYIYREREREGESEMTILIYLCPQQVRVYPGIDGGTWDPDRFICVRIRIYVCSTRIHLCSNIVLIYVCSMPIYLWVLVYPGIDGRAWDTDRTDEACFFNYNIYLYSKSDLFMFWLPQQNYSSRTEADRYRAPDRQPPPTTQRSEHTNIITSY